MDILLLSLCVMTFLEVIILVLLLKRANIGKIKPLEEKIKVKKEKFDIKKVRPEQWVIFAIYLTVLGIFAYFLIGSVLPKSIAPIDNNFVISADSIQVFDKLSSFYIDKDNVLGSKETINETNVRKVTSAEAFNLVLKPKTVIAEGTQAELEINLVGTGSNVYLNDKAIVPDLTNYELIKDYANEAVYMNKKVKKYYSTSFVNSNEAQDFVYKNFPGASVYSFADSKKYVPKIEGYEQTWTKIDTTIRNHLKLAVYVEGSLQIDFTKQDLDQTVGKDEYTVEIKDQDGKSYFKKLYEDDGDTSDSNKLGKEQDFKIRLNDIPRGVYYVTFTRDKYNKWEDSTLKNIEINSNKILLLGNLMMWGQVKLYTKVYSPQKIEFQTYWKKDNIVRISGDVNEKITIKETGTKYPVELDIGEYNIYNEVGKFWMFFSPGFSITNYNWFDIPKKNEVGLNNPDLIILDKNKLDIKGNYISFKENIAIDKDTKFKLQFVNEDKLYLKNIQLRLK